MMMLIFSALDSDANINKIAPALFDVYPNIESLAVSNEEALFPNIFKMRNFENKENCFWKERKEFKIMKIFH